MTDTVALNEAIKISGLKKGFIAEKLGISRFAFQKKETNVTQFKVGEIDVLCKLLGITSLKEKDRIFFAKNVDNVSTNERMERET